MSYYILYLFTWNLLTISLIFHRLFKYMYMVSVMLKTL
uniref:Uncharacterized protein n=1 Tax=Rhizophora mucronata TaxID=61149 RepID=A0A2P2PJ18_RHIMU